MRSKEGINILVILLITGIFFFLPAIPLQAQFGVYPNLNQRQQDQNAAIMREVQEHQQMLREQEQKKKTIEQLANEGFPTYEEDGMEHFQNAFSEIKDMLEGNTEANLGRAVFLIENAFHDNIISYDDYQGALNKKIEFCNRKIEEERFDPDNNLVKNMMLFRILCDTMEIKTKDGKTLTHFPIQYNLDDYASKESYDSHFVTTLMKTGKGQCHSMPLYYLILAEKLGAEAYWSFSPRHSFVKIQDENENWYNLELTCKAILSDAHYMNSSYIKAEAIRNRIYLEPIDKKQTIADMMLNLARYYYERFGLDDFYLACIDAAEPHLSNQLDALILKSIYEERLTLTLAHLLEAFNPEMMKGMSPEAYKHFEAMQSINNQIDNLGYEELPEELYDRWLKHIASEKEKANKQETIFINIPRKEGR